MALVKCSECGKQVSDKANVCPACGNPVGGGGSVASSAFEKRIEQYKTNGYQLIKRNGDTVQMLKFKFTGYLAIALIFGLPMMFYGITLTIGNYWTDSNPPVGFLTIIIGIACMVIFTYLSRKQTTVSISLNKAGKIIEEGNVLKSK